MTSTNKITTIAANLDRLGQHEAAEVFDALLKNGGSYRLAAEAAFMRIIRNEAPHLEQIGEEGLENLSQHYHEAVANGHADEAMEALRGGNPDTALADLKQLSGSIPGAAAAGGAIAPLAPGADSARDRFNGYSGKQKAALGVGALGLAGAGAAGIAALGGGQQAASGQAPGLAAPGANGEGAAAENNGWMGYGAAMLPKLGFEKATNHLQHDMRAKGVPQQYIDYIMYQWHSHYDGQQSVQKEMGTVPGAGQMGLYPPTNNPAKAPAPAVGPAPGSPGTQGSSVGAQPKILGQ